MMMERKTYIRPATEVIDLLARYLCIEMDPTVSTDIQLGKANDFNPEDGGDDGDWVNNPNLWDDDE